MLLAVGGGDVCITGGDADLRYPIGKSGIPVTANDAFSWFFG